MQRTYAETDRIYRHLFKLKASFGPKANRRERAVVMIGACILEGFDTKPEIIKGLRAAGLSVNHVQTILDQQTGIVPGLHLWQRDEEERYHLLSNA